MKLIQFKSSLLPYWGHHSDISFEMLQLELDRVINKFFGEHKSMSPYVYDLNLYPRVEIEESDNSYLLRCYVEGLSNNDIILILKNSTLTIKGLKRKGIERRSIGFTYSTRYFGTFWRDIHFDQEVEDQNAVAQMDNGVLTIEVKKKEDVSQNKNVIKLEPMTSPPPRIIPLSASSLE